MLNLLVTAAVSLLCIDKATASDPVYPVVKGTPKLLGIMSQPGVDRDSCGSTRWSSDPATGLPRLLWTCRDSQPTKNGKAVYPVVANTAGYSYLNADGSPQLTMQGTDLKKPPYFPFQNDSCNTNPAGGCKDHTRFVLWPNVPPTITEESEDGSITAYTFVERGHIDGHFRRIGGPAPGSLYKMYYSPSMGSALPKVTIVDEFFWQDPYALYGVDGTVVKDGIIYLYKYVKHGTALAKVAVDKLQDKSAYEYWVGGEWVDQIPFSNATNIGVPRCTTRGQGSFYYNALWKSYVWIGGPNGMGAQFYIQTAPDPTGPWTKPAPFYKGQSGSAMFGAYSLQAHFGMTNGTGSDIYLTYTKQDALYTTPLIYVQFEDIDFLKFH